MENPVWVSEMKECILPLGWRGKADVDYVINVKDRPR
jgi:hypothetical protein